MPPDFRLLESCRKCYSRRKNSGSQMRNLGLKSIMGKFESKTELILSTCNLFRWKFAAVCQNFVRNWEYLLKNCNFLPRQIFLPTTQRNVLCRRCADSGVEIIAFPHFAKFLPVENFPHVGKFSSRNTKYGVENSFFRWQNRTFEHSYHLRYFICPKFAFICRLFHYFPHHLMRCSNKVTY